MKSNWANRTIWTGDNLDVMRGMNSESVDLIYLDPPFNSNKNYSAPIGSKAAGAAFKDTWTLSDVDLAWHGEIADRYPSLYAIIDAAGLAHSKGMKAYLIMMAIRLLEINRILKETGNVYLHCDPTANSYLKMTMDCVFGKANFRNEIAWCYSTSGKPKKWFAKKHDTILLYTKSEKGFWGDYKIPVSPEYLASHYRQTDKDGQRCRIRTDFNKTRIYYPEEGMTCNDWWNIPYLNSQAKERIGYPTQKPLALLHRVIEASSKESDIVLDPFCGCATALIAAENLNRQWVGIDLSEKAVDLVQLRMYSHLGLFYESTHRTDIPKRTDQGKLPDYRTHKHTLFGKQEGVCAGCKTAFPFRNFTIDHIISRSKGGTDHYDNLQLLCAACNSTKGTGTQAEMIAKLKQYRIRQ